MEKSALFLENTGPLWQNHQVVISTEMFGFSCKYFSVCVSHQNNCAEKGVEGRLLPGEQCAHFDV